MCEIDLCIYACARLCLNEIIMTVRKYMRYEKRHSNLSAHLSPCFRVREGDKVVVGQCRPLSKTVRFNTLKVIPAATKATKGFKGF